MPIKLRPGQYYGEVRSPRVIPGFRLMELVYPPGVRFPKHSHESSCFSIMLQGGLTENYVTRVLESNARTVGFNAANEEHSNTISPAGARFLLLEVEPELTRRALRHSGSFAKSAVFRGGEINWLATKLFREAVQLDEVSPLSIEGVALEMIAALCRTSTTRNVRRPRWLAQARELVHAQFREPISVSYVADRVGVHRVYLARAFRQHYQSSIGNYVRMLRIESVQNDLCSSNFSLAEIALKAGFYDQGHMTRLFKRATGLTPARYRVLMR
jgi:AraC family transcriptional regulator